MWSNPRMAMLVKRSKYVALESLSTFLGAFVCAVTALSVPVTLRAQGFSAVISPPRFEVNVQPGKTTRQIIEITHVANQPGKYRVYTNDWTIGADGNAVFSEALAPDSCRPWVALERRELTLAGNAKIRFRFEISPPANTPTAECRFAVMIEGLEQVIKTEGPVSFPVSGRVGVVVYAIVGDARPILEINHAGTGTRDGMVVPQVEVRNTGNAHGRLAGYVSGIDAQARQIDFVPEGLPILPSQTRFIVLIPNVPGNDPVKLAYPLTVKGDLEWGNQKTAIDLRFEAPATKSTPPAATLPTPSKAKPLVPGATPK
jgi:hypothetical protein